MRKKKCITLITRLIVFSMVISSNMIYSFGFSDVKALDQNDISISLAKQAERQIYTGSFLLTNTSSVAASDLVQGDVNEDGRVDSIDYAYMRLCLLGDERSIILPYKVLIADLNMDQRFNCIDLGIMRGYLLGIFSKYLFGLNESSSVPNVPSGPKDTMVSPIVIPTPLAGTSNIKPLPTLSPVEAPIEESDDFTSTISKASYPIEVGKEVKGKLNYEGDRDYMIFVPPVNGKYRVDIFTNTSGSIGYLYSEKIEGLEHFFTSYKTYYSDDGYYIEQDLLGGSKYYLVIKNLSGMLTLDSYTIKITKL